MGAEARQRKGLARATQHNTGGPALPETSPDLLPRPLWMKWALHMVNISARGPSHPL